jgi:glycosyltransferase involved in cell wall biosynthesis
MNIRMFSSWQVRCGIADPHAREMFKELNALPDTHLEMVPFDRKPHPRSDYAAWGRCLNEGDVAHIQFDYSFFDYLLPWREKFTAMRREIQKPLVITRHVSFDGPLLLADRSAKGWIRRAKWRLYQHALNPYATFLNRTIFEQAAHVIVLTTRLKEQLLRRGIGADKISVIPAGVRKPPAITGGDQIRAKYGWQDKRIIGQFGFIAPPKGHTLTLEALARLPEDRVLLIAGGLRLAEHQPFLDDLNARIRKLGLENRVRITGFLEESDVAAHVGACDALAFPYTHADFSQSVADALAFAHAPVVASDIPGHREIAGYCPALRLFASGDAQALADALARAVNDLSRIADDRAVMRQYAVEYSWNSIARRTRDVYAGLLR